MDTQLSGQKPRVTSDERWDKEDAVRLGDVLPGVLRAIGRLMINSLDSAAIRSAPHDQRQDRSVGPYGWLTIRFHHPPY